MLLEVQNAGHKDFSQPVLAAEPIFKIFYWLFLSPNRIVFDKKSYQFVCIPGGWSRRIICIIFNFCVPLNVLIDHAYVVEEMNSGTLKLMYKIAYAVYLLWGLSCSYILWARMTDVVEIFNEFVSFNQKCISMGYQIPKRRFLSNDVTLTWILSGIVLAISTLDNVQGLWEMLEISHDFKGIGEHTLRCLRLLPNGSTFTSGEVPALVLYLAAGVYTVTNTWRGICFTHLDLLVACWAMQFRGMIQTINKNLVVQINEKQQSLLAERKIQNMLLYMKFSAILERFNETQGIIILSGTVAEIFYVSTCSAIFAADNGKSSTFHTVTVLTSFLPFLLALAIPAELNKLVKKFVYILKQSCIQELESSQPTNQAISDAVAHVQHDLEMNSIGFQGVGFFTLTYGFLGSIITAITTYSLIILQLSEKVNSNVYCPGNESMKN